MLPCWLVELWLFSSVVFQQIPASTALTYTSAPHNISQESGKPVSFLCGVSPETASLKLNFTIYSHYGNHSLFCPGGTVNLQPEGLKGHCEVKGQELRALWSIAHSMPRDDGTLVVCRSTGLPPAYGYLTLNERDSYFATLIGCVVGGFFGILVIFGFAFLGLKRSEKCRRLLKGRSTQDDISVIAEQ
ncbi:hypothetical protein JZ751_004728 [Albula glossodonta]|uniref:Ig-like domain-containing protein n=1 Tax=Albula glossodonta TaxID=121402 RepID=A0A8T2NG26_9TELE|nr:hypothetical protein JZ751_004728 [Albula glossodonta]